MNENNENPTSPSGNNGTEEIASQATEYEDVWGSKLPKTDQEAAPQTQSGGQASTNEGSPDSKTEKPTENPDHLDRNRYGDLYPFQQDRPDPRTQTPEEYAKQSIDRFFEIARKTNEAKRGKPLSASSVA